MLRTTAFSTTRYRFILPTIQNSQLRQMSMSDSIKNLGDQLNKKAGSAAEKTIEMGEDAVKSAKSVKDSVYQGK